MAAPAEKTTMGGLDEADDETLFLSSKEDKSRGEFEISRKAALISNLVKSIVEGDSNATRISLKVRGDILDLIVQYLKIHHGVEAQEIIAPIESIEKDVTDERDVEFINNMNVEMVMAVIISANYMDIPSLLHLGCAKMATLIKREGEILETLMQLLEPRLQALRDSRKRRRNELLARFNLLDLADKFNIYPECEDPFIWKRIRYIDLKRKLEMNEEQIKKWMEAEQREQRWYIGGMEKQQMKLKRLESKQRAIMVKEHWKHWIGSEGKALVEEIREIVFKYYAGTFEWDKSRCHSDWKVTNGNKTITKTLDTGCRSVYSKNMVNNKTMDRAIWEITLKGHKAGPVCVGMVDAQYIESVDPGKSLAPQYHIVAVDIADNKKPRCCCTIDGAGWIGHTKVNWNIGDRLKLDFDLTARSCTLFSNGELLGTLDDDLFSYWDPDCKVLHDSFFFAVSSECPGVEVETTLFEAW